MKKNHLIAFFLFALGILGCKKESLLTYDESSSSNIYFPETYSKDIDTAYLGVAYLPLDSEQVVYRLPIRITGSPAKTDRTYNLQVNSTLTSLKEGTDFQLNGPMVIPAGAVTDTLSVVFIRKQNLQNKAGSVYLELKANENFQTALIKDKGTLRRTYTNMKIVLDNSISSPPPFWTLTGSAAPNYLGTFSAKKFQLMVQVLHLNVEEVINPAYRPVLIIAWANIMQSYLKEQTLAGHPVYEEDGSLMKMGPSVK